MNNRNASCLLPGVKRLLLASASPRRRELLGSLGFDVEIVRLKDVDESYPLDLPPEEVSPYISRKKALAYGHDFAHGDVLVTADTVVINNGRVLGKPADAAEAADMLAALSGHTHRVVTGVTLTTPRETVTFSETTEVDFAALSADEIDFYVENYSPLDKAGAYGIQEWIGYIGITGIRGDYYNVMGLPLRHLYEALKAL